MAIIIIIAIIAVLAIWVVGVQRKLVKQEEVCKNGMSQIGVQLSSRWDALTSLAELIKSYNEHEYKTLQDVIAARTGITGNSSAEEVQKQEGALKDLASRINLVVERYPDLKANENYAKAMDSVNTYENQVRMSRMVYNDSVTLYNRIVRQFPDSIVASLFHFAEKPYLEEDKTKTDRPSMAI